MSAIWSAMWTATPTAELFRRATRQPRREVKTRAARSWRIAPPETSPIPRAYFLPGQLERVTGHEFASDSFAADMHGGREVSHAETRAYLIEEAMLINGVLYKDDASTYLTSGHHRIPPVSVRGVIDRGAIYCTPGGNGYFGQWLIDDCVTYPLACAEGVPVTTHQPMGAHAAVYEQWLEMQPCRVKSARFRELVIFDDFGQNRHKRDRFRALTAKLTRRVGDTIHAGVFVVRGSSGARRVLSNELELAEHLRVKRGFKIVDPMRSDVPSILQACAGAKVVVGVEGSHLVHAVMLLSEGRSILTIQPPFRFCTVLKDVADREGVRFGFVVGSPTADEFVANPDEVERTLDLLNV